MYIYKEIKENDKIGLLIVLVLIFGLLLAYMFIFGKDGCSYKQYELGLTNGKTVKGYFHQNPTGFENDSVIYPHMSIKFVKEIKEK